jgi:lysophospholipase L1-like esterase
MKNILYFLVTSAVVVAAVAAVGCGGSSVSEGDADAVDAPADEGKENVTDAVPDEDVAEDLQGDDQPQEPPDDNPPEAQPDGLEDVPFDVEEEDGTSGLFDNLGTNNQDIAGVERVIFLGDSITATPYYLAIPWSDVIKPRLRTLFGSGVEFQNYAAWGAKTEDVRDDQLPSIDTASTKRTLVMMTVGGNDALQVIGEPAEVSLAHMETKMAILEEIIQWIIDPAHFPGGVYLIYSNMYDPTDGVGDFTHCGLGVSYGDWPALPEIEPIANSWFLDLAMTYHVDMLEMHGLFLGHGYHNNDITNPWYCHDCAPDCPCPRWFDLTCIHPTGDGHAALAGFFYGMITR